jgi:lipopolysaccharide/colanic/teichoic acid biosynthesis glycosyltransferase
MSLVGPRPEAVQYATLDSPEWRDVLAVRPGLTDPTTVRLRNEEALLAAAGDRYEAFYRRYLLPYKLLGYRQYIAERTWLRDVAVLGLTLAAIVLPRLQSPPTVREIVSTVRHARAVSHTPRPTVVEDV